LIIILFFKNKQLRLWRRKWRWWCQCGWWCEWKKFIARHKRFM